MSAIPRIALQRYDKKSKPKSEKGKNFLRQRKTPSAARCFIPAGGEPDLRLRRWTSPHAATDIPARGDSAPLLRGKREPLAEHFSSTSGICFHLFLRLGYPDSNQERQDQNLQCYHYTIAQFRSQEPRPPHSGELPPGRDDTRSRCTSLSKCAAKVRLFCKPTK